MENAAIMLPGRFPRVCGTSQSLLSGGLFAPPRPQLGARHVPTTPASSPEALRAIGRGITKRRRPGHHLRHEAPGRGAERQSPMGVAIGEPQPPLSRRGSDLAPISPPSATPRRSRAERRRNGRSRRGDLARRRASGGNRDRRRLSPRRQPFPRLHHRGRLLRLQGGGRTLPSLRRTRLPVGASHADLSFDQEAQRRDHRRLFDSRTAAAGLDVRRRSGVPGLHARYGERLPLSAPSLYRDRSPLHRQGHGADAMGQKDRADRQQ